MNLRGKNVIVTGSNRGIGKATVKALAVEGANVWACARKKDEQFEHWLSELASENNVLLDPLYFDLTDDKMMKEAIKSIIKANRPIDGLVNNAGMALYGNLQMMRMEDVKRVFDNNFFSALSLTQMVMRRMTKGTGSIVFLSSISGFISEAGNVGYGGSKAAISFAVKILAKELAKDGIRVNAVAPGMVNTDMKKAASNDAWANLLDKVLLGRPAEPEEIAKVISFLLSDKSSYITAQTIHVDGGMY